MLWPTKTLVVLEDQTNILGTYILNGSYGDSDVYRYGNPPAYPDAEAASDSGTSPNAVETYRGFDLMRDALPFGRL